METTLLRGCESMFESAGLPGREAKLPDLADKLEKDHVGQPCQLCWKAGSGSCMLLLPTLVLDPVGVGLIQKGSDDRVPSWSG